MKPAPERGAGIRSMQPSRDIQRLVEIMAALRAPEGGCPWDLQQTFATIVPYTLEEAYEVADAIERGDFADLRDELGDLLLQVVFHARMAEEAGRFDFGGVVEAITTKLIRRHPHVFADARGLSPDEVKALWGRIKAEERRERAGQGVAPERRASALSGVPIALPALTRALKLQEKAGKVGFDWNDARAVLAKLREEMDEIEAEIEARDAGKVADEVGDLLFAVANLARHLHVDPEGALRGANAKFERRFGHIEARLAAAGRPLEEASLDDMEALWNEAKRLERAGS
jgi:ATP diphosphatase